MKVLTLLLWLFCVVSLAACQKNPQSPTGAMVESNQNAQSAATITSVNTASDVLGGAPTTTNTKSTNHAGIDNSGGSKSSNSTSGGSSH